jgi:predicted transcriptional regulator
MAKWSEIREARMASPEGQRGYQRAKLAYEIGTQVRELRQKAGLTQAELAALVGSSQAAIARLEAGGTEPKLSTLHEIARALKSRMEIRFVA